MKPQQSEENYYIGKNPTLRFLNFSHLVTHIIISVGSISTIWLRQRGKNKVEIGSNLKEMLSPFSILLRKSIYRRGICHYRKGPNIEDDMSAIDQRNH